VIDGYPIRIRSSRKPQHLPNFWDDIRQSKDDRCWKAFRKTQYKAKDDKAKRDSTKYAASMAKRNHWHFEHRWCINPSRRCNHCWKTLEWAEHDKIMGVLLEKNAREYLQWEIEWIEQEQHRDNIYFASGIETWRRAFFAEPGYRPSYPQREKSWQNEVKRRIEELEKWHKEVLAYWEERLKQAEEELKAYNPP